MFRAHRKTVFEIGMIQQKPSPIILHKPLSTTKNMLGKPVENAHPPLFSFINQTHPEEMPEPSRKGMPERSFLRGFSKGRRQPFGILSASGTQFIRQAKSS
jgi:hypothetical protein